MDLFAFLCMQLSTLPALFVGDPFLYQCVFLDALSKYKCLQVCEFISGISIQFYGSVCLLLYPYHTAFITIALYYSLKSGIVIPPGVLLLFRIILAIHVCVCMCMFPSEAENCLFKICEELCWDFDGDCTELVHCFWQGGHFYYINP